MKYRGWDYGIYRHFQQYFSYIVAVSFIGVGNRSPQRKPLTCRKSLLKYSTNKMFQLKHTPVVRCSLKMCIYFKVSV